MRVRYGIRMANLPLDERDPTSPSACGSSSNENVVVIGTWSPPSPVIRTTRA